MEENPIKLLRMLKGAPLSIYIAVGCAEQIVTNRWLEMVTGYTDKPVKQGLKLLEEYELITKTNRGWKIRKTKQYKLMIEKKEIKKNEKYKMLEKFGVREPKLSEIANCKNIKKEYIKAHIQKAIIENITEGLLIHRIMSRDKEPEINLNGHLKGCDCEDCRQFKYTEGKYGGVGNY